MCFREGQELSIHIRQSCGASVMYPLFVVFGCHGVGDCVKRPLRMAQLGLRLIYEVPPDMRDDVSDRSRPCGGACRPHR